MKEIYFIRHGETDWNKEFRTQGRMNDNELNEDGFNQSVKVGEYLSKHKFDLIISSGLKRSHQTAEIISYLVQLIVSSLFNTILYVANKFVWALTSWSSKKL